MLTEKYYTTQQVAEILQVSVQTIYDLVKRKKLNYFKVQHSLRIPASALERFTTTKEKT